MNLMKYIKHQAGFSLMEVNMAVFVMSVGILSMIVLFPLGLRESMQGQADIKQAMFADYVLNQAVAIASQTNIPWSQWRSVPGPKQTEGSGQKPHSVWPAFIQNKFNQPDWTDSPELNKRYNVTCALVPGMSDRVMGIMVQSTDLTTNYENYTNNPIFYAEVMFQGNPYK